MKFTIQNLIFVLAMLFFVENAFGQVTDIATPPEFVSMPKVVRPAGASGYFGSTVVVNVDVNEKGRVTSVLSVSGPELACPSAISPDINKLREVARTIALKAKFKPARVAQKAVASTASIEVVFPDPPVGRASGSGGVVMAEEKDSNFKAIQGDVATNTAAVPVRGTPVDSDVVGLKPASTTNDDSEPPDLPKTKPTAIPKTISGGVLNGKAVSLPKPAYPPAARAVKASGAVSVQVVIGEDGSMLSASPISGHPLLRSASRIAACSSKFPPTLLSGQPVKVSGVITYNFVP